MDLELDRYWLLTWTTYGSWLPGDKRGFVSNVRDGPGPEVRHNIPGTPYDADMPKLERAASTNLKCDPIRLTNEQANALLDQFLETAAYRRRRSAARCAVAPAAEAARASSAAAELLPATFARSPAE